MEGLGFESDYAPRSRYLCLFRNKGLSSNSFTASIVYSCSVLKSLNSAMHPSSESLYYKPENPHPQYDQ